MRTRRKYALRVDERHGGQTMLEVKAHTQGQAMKTFQDLAARYPEGKVFVFEVVTTTDNLTDDWARDLL